MSAALPAKVAEVSISFHYMRGGLIASMPAISQAKCAHYDGMLQKLDSAYADFGAASLWRPARKSFT